MCQKNNEQYRVVGKEIVAWTTLCGVLMLFIFWSTSTTAWAQTVDGQAAVSVGVDNLDGALIRGAIQSGKVGENRFGLRLQAGLARERFIGGFPVGSMVDTGALSVSGQLYGTWNLKHRGGSRFDLTTGLGGRFVFADEATSAGDRSIAVTTTIAPTFSKQIGERTTFFTTVHMDTDFALDPGFELDMNALPMEVGARYWLTDNLALSASALVGGAFGYGGDGAKWRGGVNVGVEYAFDRSVSQEESKEGGTGYFVEAGWRGYAIGGHLSHGPEVRMGVSLLSNHLKVGLAFQGRPGPMNPETFELKLEDGQEFNGKQNLALRSDGANVGISVAPVVGVTEWLALELPVTVGQAAYGFYLTGDDRKSVPEGERVSEVENKLQDGRDASFAIGIDAGLRAKFVIPGATWIQPMVGVHYMVTPGYDAFLKDDYSGLSIAAGVQLAAF